MSHGRMKNSEAKIENKYKIIEIPIFWTITTRLVETYFLMHATISRALGKEINLLIKFKVTEERLKVSGYMFSCHWQLVANGEMFAN